MNEFTVIAINEETGHIYADYVNASSSYKAMYQAAQQWESHPVSIIAAIKGHLRADIDIDYAGDSLVDVGTILDQKEVFDA